MFFRLLAVFDFDFSCLLSDCLQSGTLFVVLKGCLPFSVRSIFDVSSFFPSFLNIFSNFLLCLLSDCLQNGTSFVVS